MPNPPPRQIIAPPRAAARAPESQLARIWRISHNVTTMPWPCLQAAIDQILAEGDPLKQETQLEMWQKLKNQELMNVEITGTLIAGAVTGSIQWPSLQTAHWFVFACWYTTLLFSLLSVMVAFYLSILLSNFAINPRGTALLLRSLHKTKDPLRSRYASLFALQVPLMLLSYSLIGYVMGLALLVIRPLWTEPWGDRSAVAICFIVFFAFGIVAFGSVCHFIYAENEEVLKVD